MDVQKLILATIAAGNVGCKLCTYQEEFSVDAEFTAEDIEYLMALETTSEEGEIRCEDACRLGFDKTHSREPEEIDAIDLCEFTLQEGDTASGATGVIDCDGTVGKEYPVQCGGRRPLGHVESTGSTRTLGERLAHIAHLEAASVVAFLQLVRQLRALGAPEQLVERCRQAAAEEVVHARLFARLARRCGASIPDVRQEPAAEDLLSIALHNATEGCVGETWAALQARYQAHHSPDPLLRRVFLRVAADEARHAQLAWDLHAWLLARLDPAQQVAIRAAQREALAALPALAARQSTASPALLGLPSPALAASLAARFAAGLAA